MKQNQSRSCTAITPKNRQLLRFLVWRVLPARIAKLRRLEPLLMLFAVLHGRVVSVFALTALQCDDFAHGPLLEYLGDGVLRFAQDKPAPDCYVRLCSHYSRISVTAPAPTVWPPSRIAKRKPFSSATGVISFTSTATLSPGITISTPVGNATSPVTSVVRK